MKTSIALKSALGAAALTLPLMTLASSTFTTGGGALTASAPVTFSIVIPKILFLRVGGGSTYPLGMATVAGTGADNITFTVPAANVGNGTAVAGTGGDQTGGVDTAAVVSNGGQVTLTANATGALSNGAGDTINYTQIVTGNSANLTAGFATLAPPVLSNGVSTVLPPLVGKITAADSKWTYTYSNSAVVPPGTYGATVANNGVVTYTAAVL